MVCLVKIHNNALNRRTKKMGEMMIEQARTLPYSSDIVTITCALTGVLTNPQQHPVPVTPEEMATSAKQAYDQGASIMHVHFRSQEENKGHLPTWDPQVANDIITAIREACPGVIINMTTGVMGQDISGPLACLDAIKPEIAACNAGTLNYLKTRRLGEWAWPPMVFENPVSKVQAMVEAMKITNTIPEFECFDVGIIRSLQMYIDNGWAPNPPHSNLVMGVASGMPADHKLLELIINYLPQNSPWQTTVIGRSEVWEVHQKTAELGGHLRTGVEDTFYLPNGDKCTGNGQLIEKLASIARETGRKVANPHEARTLFGLT